MKLAVISLDIINELCDPQGKLARYVDRIIAQRVIENINSITAYSRAQHQALVAHVRLAFRSSYLDGAKHSPLLSGAISNKLLKEDAWGSAFNKQLTISENDVLISKHRVSAFYATDLDLVLRANQIDTLILMGVATNNAVELTAREAHDRDYKVIIVSDATETTNDEEKLASLGFLSKIAMVRSTKEVLSGQF